ISKFCQAVSTLVPGSVDTSPSLQKTQLPDWDKKEVVALKAEKQKLQHELKNTTNTSLASVKTKKNEKKTTIIFVKVAANKNTANSNEKLVKVLVQKQMEKNKNATVKKIHLLPPSVQKAPRQVPNSHHAKSHQKVPPSPHGKPTHMKRRFQQIHTFQGKYQFRNRCLPHVRVAGGSERPVRLPWRPGWARSGSGLGGRHDTVGVTTPRPVAFWGPEDKSLGRFPLFLFSLPFSSLRRIASLSGDPAVRAWRNDNDLCGAVVHPRGSEEEVASSS
ncbi:hypothetical protein Taro_050883, partial [Colocasia esculenta]|nr:hypothetical protein [Colocasia esculenta]